jgi:membrane protein implicated in regulation of membrane protease activity
VTFVDLYWVCLIVGLSLATLSLFLGMFHVDLPGTKWDFLTGGHLHANGLLPGHGPGGGATSGHLSAANFSTLMVFLAWFGGAGVLLTKTFHWRQWMALPGASVSGVFGAYLVYLFVARVLTARDHSMRPHEYMLAGTLATLTLAIREGGTGEIGYVQGGTRKSAAARAEASEAIALGTEVIVTRFEDGIAYVRRFDPERMRTM